MKKSHQVKRQNRTKIIATVGPSSNSVEVLMSLIQNGCSIFRINFSHGTHDEHEKSIQAIRTASKNLGQYVSILGDLQGPKIRIGAIKGDSFDLVVGQVILLDSDIDDELGSIDGVSYRCDTLAESCEPGRLLLLDDGVIQLEVIKVEGKCDYNESHQR